MKKLKSKLATLEENKIAAQNQLNAIEKQIKLEKDKLKPKSITESVKTLKDVIRLAEPTKEELSILNYKGKSIRLIFLKSTLVVSLISEVLNEGWLPKMGGSENRYYAWFYLQGSSGFEFSVADCGLSFARACSASRLCFKTRELAEYAGKTFTNEYRNFIVNSK